MTASVKHWGVAGAPFTSADQSSAAASVTDAPRSGECLVIEGLTIAVGTTMTVTLKEETSGDVILGPLYILANTSIHIPFGRKLPTAGKKLQVLTSASGNVMVLAGYRSEA